MTTPGVRVTTAPGLGPARWCPTAPPRLLAEAAVLVGAACLLLHLTTALGGHPRDVVHTGVLLGMAAACAPCLRALWVGPVRRDWQLTAAMYAAMLTAHLWWLGSGPAHAAHARELSWSTVGMWGGLGLAAVQLCLTGIGLTLSRERNRT
jgi:hypothetical protein